MARNTKKLISSIRAITNEFNEDGKVVHFRDCFDTLKLAKALK